MGVKISRIVREWFDFGEPICGILIMLMLALGNWANCEVGSLTKYYSNCSLGDLPNTWSPGNIIAS